MANHSISYSQYINYSQEGQQPPYFSTGSMKTVPHYLHFHCTKTKKERNERYIYHIYNIYNLQNNQGKVFVEVFG